MSNGLLTQINDIGLLSARPAAAAANEGYNYHATDEGITYRSNGASWDDVAINEAGHAALDHTGLPGVDGAGVTNLARARAKRAAGNYTINGAGSGSFAAVDSTNLALALTTGARIARVSLVAMGSVNNAGGAICLDVDIDGTRMGGGSDGLVFVSQHATASEIMNLSFSIDTDVLSAGPHTFTLVWRQGTEAHTATLWASSIALIFSVAEQYAA